MPWRRWYEPRKLCETSTDSTLASRWTTITAAAGSSSQLPPGLYHFCSAPSALAPSPARPRPRLADGRIVSTARSAQQTSMNSAIERTMAILSGSKTREESA